MNHVESGPYKQQLIDELDFYKTTMSQVAYEKQPDAGVTFQLKNRSHESLFAYIDKDTLQSRLNTIAERGFDDEELVYLGSLSLDDKPLFSETYIDYLRSHELPPITVDVTDFSVDIQVASTGDWPIVTFWETVTMAEINELYFETLVARNGIDITALYDEGDERLSQKIARLHANPGIKIADFGTRRHFSYRWQKYVVERLANELPKQFIGSSNVGLSKQLGTQPVGTFAHEMPMVYAALADKHGETVRPSHNAMLDDWYSRYGSTLSIALTDTFGSDFFFADFGGERAAAWRGIRHDSGDPIAFGEKAISFYQQHGIDPTTKTIVFSDGLTIDDIVTLYNHFEGRIKTVFGWGTSLTNDLGIPALNIVMKATMVDGTPTVKLSDVSGKHTGDDASVERYIHEFAA
jgi:nicotinate phosphoribosyltransferase